MQTSTARRTLARELRRQGLSYRQIKVRVPASLDSIGRWVKDITIRQTNRRTDGQVGVNKDSKTDEFRDNKIGVSDTIRVNKIEGKTLSKGKAFPVWLGIVIIFLIMFFAFIALWLRQSEQTDSKRIDGQPKNKENLFNPDRTLEGLEEIPGEEGFEDEDYQGCCGD